MTAAQREFWRAISIAASVQLLISVVGGGASMYMAFHLLSARVERAEQDIKDLRVKQERTEKTLQDLRSDVSQIRGLLEARSRDTGR